nr:response regulator transcription factor [Pseudofrankia sp. BMG5.36]
MRIVVADDAVLLREGLIRLLAEEGHQVVAAVGDAPALVEAVLRHRPDVSVVDVRMPPTHTDEGLRAAISVRSRLPRSPVLVLSQYVETSYAADLLADGSGGVVGRRSCGDARAALSDGGDGQHPGCESAVLLPDADADGRRNRPGVCDHARPGQARQRLADSSRAGARTPPAIDVMIADFSRYHAVMAVIATIAAASLLGTSVLLWKRFARTASSDRRTRRVVGSFGVLSALLTLGLIVHAAANATTAADRGPALLGALKGGW